MVRLVDGEDERERDQSEHRREYIGAHLRVLGCGVKIGWMMLNKLQKLGRKAVIGADSLLSSHWKAI